MKTAASMDAAEARAAIQNMSLNASKAGKRSAPIDMVTEVRTAATAALDVEVPIDRTRLFNPFAEAVSVMGTAAMIRVGMEAKAIAVPTLTTVEPMITKAIES